MPANLGHFVAQGGNFRAPGPRKGNSYRKANVAIHLTFFIHNGGCHDRRSQQRRHPGRRGRGLAARPHRRGRDAVDFRAGGRAGHARIAVPPRHPARPHRQARPGGSILRARAPSDCPTTPRCSTISAPCSGNWAVIAEAVTHLRHALVVEPKSARHAGQYRPGAEGARPRRPGGGMRQSCPETQARPRRGAATRGVGAARAGPSQNGRRIFHPRRPARARTAGLSRQPRPGAVDSGRFARRQRRL